MARFYTVREVAKLFKKHLRTIYRWLDEGFIRGKKVRDGWLIPEEEIIRVMKDPFEDDEVLVFRESEKTEKDERQTKTSLPRPTSTSMQKSMHEQNDDTRR